MRSRIYPDKKPGIWAVLLLLLSLAGPAAAADGQATVAGLPEQEALRLGEAMYMKGMLPSGKPIKAFVQEDLEVTGRMTTCANCHRRSGLGSVEGGVLTPPTNGAILYAPIQGQQDIPGVSMKGMVIKYPRPAYNDKTLADALLIGIDPTGRKLGETMPRYLLNEDETKILIFYLKNLSSRFSPGVTHDEVRFATLVTDRVSQADRSAMLQPLTDYIEEEWNEIYTRMSHNKPIAGKQSHSAYRKASLDVWKLTGPSETWGRQLEEFYRQKPVFALLGGLVQGKWAPVHAFCEKNKIPCIFPITDLPVVSGSDWYTLYFSKGYYQEGETAAKYLSRVIDLPADKQVIQVLRDTDESNALSRGFAETWKKFGNTAVETKIVAANDRIDEDFWKKLAKTHPKAVILAWLGPEDLSDIKTIAETDSRPSTLFVSATMLSGALASLPDKVRDFTFITYPTRLPNDGADAKTVVDLSNKLKKSVFNDSTIASKSYFIARTLSNTIIEMGGNFYRDYFLDILDDGKDQDIGSFLYPMLSFGPGQRYASKGCYVVTLTKGEKPQVIRQSDWVIY